LSGGEWCAGEPADQPLSAGDEDRGGYRHGHADGE
jgi:hypothetical protein